MERKTKLSESPVRIGKSAIKRVAPSYIKEEIEQRIITLKEIVEYAEKQSAAMPEGTITVAPGKTANSFRYYFRGEGQKELLYMTKNQENMKILLSQKKYYNEIVKKGKRELKALEKADSLLAGDSIVSAFIKQNNGIKKYIKPFIKDDETFVNEWINEKYTGLGFDPNDRTEYYTDKNERVRSKSEIWIANELNKNGIPYKYECPIILNNGTCYVPDFTILNVRQRKVKYWEHLGKMDSFSYIQRTILKLDDYKRAGLYIGDNLIITFEAGDIPIGKREIIEMIERFCK